MLDSLKLSEIINISSIFSKLEYNENKKINEFKVYLFEKILEKGNEVNSYDVEDLLNIFEKFNYNLRIKYWEKFEQLVLSQKLQFTTDQAIKCISFMKQDGTKYIKFHNYLMEFIHSNWDYMNKTVNNSLNQIKINVN